MSYHIHHTEGIILQSKGVHDANSVLFIYTKDMGLIIAKATSLRSHKSRLRFILQRFSRAHIDLVRGKHNWILTSARQININSDIYRHENRKVSFASLTGLILRLIQGEESNPLLYDDICELIETLRTLESREACYAFELLSSVRVLNHLGYWDKKDGDDIFLDKLNNKNEILSAVFKNRKVLVAHINEAFKHTNL